MTSLVHSGYLLWYLMITLLILSDKHICCFYLPIWYLLSNPVEPSDYSFISFWIPFGIFCLPLCYLLLPVSVHSGKPYGTLQLPFSYLLPIPWDILVTTLLPIGYPFLAPSSYFFGILCLPIWYLLVTSLIPSALTFGTFWLPLWLLQPKPLVLSDCLFATLWLPLWNLLIIPLISSA
jgi:hypothetical protein